MVGRMNLEGLTIKKVRLMTKREMEKEGWEDHPPCTVLELDGGVKLYASRDDEGNGPRAMFGSNGLVAFAV